MFENNVLARVFLITLFFGALPCEVSFAQSYDYNMGYIFDQPFVSRIKESQQRELIDLKLKIPFEASSDAQNITRQRKFISRQADRLTIKIPGNPSIALTDFSRPDEGDTEGDSQIFRYDQILTNLKTGAAFHKVDVFFGHDRPFTLLINSKTGKMYFVDFE